MVGSPFLSIHLYVDSMVWSVHIHGVQWVVSEVCIYHFLPMYRPSYYQWYLCGLWLCVMIWVMYGIVMLWLFLIIMFYLGGCCVWMNVWCGCLLDIRNLGYQWRYKLVCRYMTWYLVLWRYILPLIQLWVCSGDLGVFPIFVCFWWGCIHHMRQFLVSERSEL